MKTHKKQFKRLIYMVVVFLSLLSCKKDDIQISPFKTGSWSGTGISFSVESTPGRIADLEFSYSGHATGSICSFDYESGASFAEVATISGNTFTAKVNNFDISGKFTNDTIAEIEISWTNYDPNCDANYSGNKVYIAHYLSSK